MAQETQTQSTPLRSTFDDARDISHNEGLIIAIGHDTQRRFHRGKGIVGYLGTGTTKRTKQCALTCIGEAYQADISKKFQFENNGTLLHRFTRLGITRCLIGRSAEVPVAQTSTTTFQEHNHLSILTYVTDVFACLCIIDNGSTRDIDISVLSICACASAFASIATMSGKDMTFVTQVKQRPIVVIPTQIDMSATSPVSTIWATIRNVLSPMHVHRTSSTLARAATYLYIIYEVAFHSQKRAYFNVSRKAKMFASI